MQSGSISVSIPSLTKYKTELDNLVIVNLKSRLKFILNEMCEEYNLPQSTVFDKYLSDEIVLIDTQVTKKKKKRTPTVELCKALVQNGNQCSRRKKDECDFCGSHISNRPFGVVVEEDIEEAAKIETEETGKKSINIAKKK
jgi:hypothetical protein